MPLKVKIIGISIYYLMYKHLYNMALNLDVAFLLSVSILALDHLNVCTCSDQPVQDTVVSEHV